MSTSVDNRVVKMEFDNAQFEQGVAQSLQTLTKLDAALNDLDNAGGFKGLSNSIQGIGTELEDTFSFKGVAALTTFQKIAEGVIGKVVGLFSGLKNNYMPVDFIDQAITGGRNRAANIENAKFRLEGLGVAYKNVANDIDYAVKDTAYGLDSAAKAASIMVAQGMEFGTVMDENGTKASALGKALRGISGVAAMTNSSYDEIADIFEKIGSRNKVQAREANMLTSRALPLYATLTKYFNGVIDGSIEASDSVTRSIMQITKGLKVTQDDFVEFSKDGVINGEIFFEAMDTMFGQHAKEANKTYAGSLDNVRAALSRLGAVYQQGHMDNMIEVFNSLRLYINEIKAALTPLIERFVTLERRMTHGFSRVLNITRDSLGPALENISFIVRKVIATVTREFHKFFPEVNIDKIASKIVDLNNKIASFSFNEDAWTGFKGVLDSIFSIASLVKTVLTDIGYILEPWLETLNIIAGDLVTVFADLGIKIGDFNDAVENSTGLQTFVEILRMVSEFIAGKVSTAFNILTLLITDFDTGIRVILYSAFLMLLRLFPDAITKIEEFRTKIEGVIKPVQLFALHVGYVISSLVSGFTTLGFYINMFKERIQTAFDEEGLQGAVKAFIECVKLVPAAIVASFRPFANVIMTYIRPGLDAIEIAFNDFKLSVQTKLNELGTTIYNALPEPLQNAIDTIKSFWITAKQCFETLGIFVRSFINIITNGFSEGGIKGAVDAFVNVLGLIPGAVSVAFAPLKSMVTTALDNAKARFDEFVEEIKANPIVKTISQLFTDIKTEIDNFVNNFSFENIGTQIETFFDGIVSSITDFVTNFSGEDVLTDLKGLFESIYEYISGTTVGKIVSSMYEAGKAAIDGLVQGFLDGTIIDTLFGAITDLVGSKESGTGIIGFFANLVGWHSPWQIMILAGAAALVGLALGFKDSAGLAEIKNAIKEDVKSILKYFEPVIDGVRTIGSAIWKNLKTIYEPFKPLVEGAIKWVRENVTFDNIVKGITLVIDAIGELAGMVASFVGGALTWLGPKLTEASTAVTDFFNSFKTNIKLDKIFPDFDKLKSEDSALGKILGFFGTISEKVKDITGWLGDAATGKLGPMIQQALGLSILVALPTTLRIAARAVDTAQKGIVNVSTRVKDVLQIVKQFFSFVKGFATAIEIQINIKAMAKLFTSLALFVGVIAAAVYAIAKLDTAQFAQAQNAFTDISLFLFGFTIVLGVITAIITALSNNNVTTTLVKGKLELKRSINAMTDTALVIIAIGGAMYLLSKAIDSIVKTLQNTTITAEQYKGAFWTIGGFTLFLSVGAGAISVLSSVAGSFVDKTGKLIPIKPKLLGAAITVLAVAYAVKLMVDTFADLLGICEEVLHGNTFKNGPETLKQASDILLAICTAVFLISGAGALVGVKGGLGLLGIMASILMLKEVFNILIDPVFSSSTLFYNMESILTALGLISLIMFTTRFAGPNAAKGGLAVLAVVGSIILIMKAFVKLSKELGLVRWEDVVKGLAVVVVAMGGIAALILATNKCATSFKAALVLFTLNSLIFTMGAVAALMTVCATISPDGFASAVVALGGLLIVLALLVAATKFIPNLEKSTKIFTGLASMMWAIGASLVVLSLISWDKVSHALMAIGGVLVLIAIITGISIKANVGPILAAVGMLVAVAVSLGVLASIFDDTDKLLKTAESIAIVVGALVVAMGACALVGAFAEAAAAGIVIMIATFAALALLFASAVALCSDPAVQTAVVGFGHMIGSFIGAISAGFQEASATALPIVGDYLSQFANNASGFFDMIEGKNFEEIGAGIKSLMQALGQITTNRAWEDIVTSLSNSGNTSMTQFCRDLIQFGVALNGFSVAITANGGINKDAVDSAVEAGEMLVALEKKITPFGNIIDFFSKRTFSDFGVSLMDFADGMKKLFGVFTKDITEDTIDTALTTTSRLVDMEGRLPTIGGIVDWFKGRHGDFGTFGDNLTDLATALGTFCEKSQAVKVGHINNVINATNKLIELAATVSGSGASDRGFEFLFWGGKNIYDDFGKNMDELCTKLVSISGSFQLIDTNLLTSTANNISKLVSAFSSMTSINTEGINGVANALGSINADAITNFINSFASIDGTQIDSISTFISSFTTILTTQAINFEEPGKDATNSYQTGMESQATLVAPTTGTTIVTTFVNGIKAALSTGLMQQAAVDAVNGFNAGITAQSGNLMAAGSKTGEDYLTGFKNKTGWASPWSTMIAAGKDAVLGLINGVNDSGMKAQLKATAEELGGDKNSGSGILGWFANKVGWHSRWEQTFNAGKDGVLGLINGIEDPAIRSVLKTAADALGTDTLDTIVKSLDGKKYGDVVVELGKKIGLDFTYSVENGVQLGKGGIELSADSIIEMLTGKSKIAHGLFNFMGNLNKDPIEDYPEYVREQFNKLQASMTEVENESEETGGEITNLGGSLGGAAKSAEDAAEAAKKHAKAVKHEGEAVNAFVEMTKSAGDVFKDVGHAEFAKQAIEELARTFGKTADEIGTSEEDIEELFNSMYDTVKGSIEGSISMFEEFKVEASGSVKDMIYNMRSNLNGIEEFGDKLAELSMRGFAPKLIEELQAAGPKAMNQVNQLLKASLSEMFEINDLYASKENKVDEVTAKVIASMAYAMKTQEHFAKFAADSLSALSFDDAIAGYDKAVAEFAKYNVDATNTIYGNIDMNNRKTLELTEDYVKEYHDILANWMSEDELQKSIGSVATVLGTSKNYGSLDEPLEIAFSPILQTEDGAKVLSEGTIDKYMNAILDKAREECGEFSNEDLIRLDAEGLEIDGEKICKVIADIGTNAQATGELLHYIGPDGEIAQSWAEVEKAANVAIANIVADIDRMKVTYGELRSGIRETVNSQIDLFTKFEKKNAMSSGEILSNMKSQIDGFTEWGANLAKIAEKTANSCFSDKGAFLQKIQAMGPKSADLIAGMANMTMEEFNAMAAYWEQGANLGDTIGQNVADSYLNAGLTSANAMIDKLNETIQARNPEAVAYMRTLAQDDANGFSTTMSTTGASLMTQACQTAVTAYQTAMNTAEGHHSPSQWWIDLGMDDIQGFINGVNAKADNALFTIGYLCSRIHNKAKTELSQQKFYQIGVNIVLGLVNGIEQNAQLAIDAGFNLGKETAEATARGASEESPSKFTMQVGRYIDEGLIIGINQEKDKVLENAFNMARAVNEAIDESLNTEFDDGFHPTITPVLDLTDVQDGLGSVGSMFGDSTVYASRMASTIGSTSLSNNAMANLANAINGMSGRNPQNTNTYNITINTQPGQNAREIADMVVNRISSNASRRKAAYA